MIVEEDFYGNHQRKLTVSPKESNDVLNQLLAFPGPGLLHYRFIFQDVISIGLSQKVDEVTTKVDSINDNVNVMTTAMDDLKAKILALEKRKSPSCSVCLEDFTSTSKIAQCISGHFVCWSCKERLERKKRNNCEFCGEPINGRALGMEQHLRDNM